MDPIYIVIVLVFLLLLAVAYLLVASNRNDSNLELAGRLEAMQNEQANTAKTLKETLDESFAKSRDEVAKQNKERDEAITQVREKLAVLDEFKKTVDKLDENVMGFQQIFDNPSKRGAFGESQLRDIVETVLPREMYAFQHTVANKQRESDVRFDCFLRLPDPPGPVGIDSKFPLTDYHNVVNADSDDERKNAAKAFKAKFKTLLEDISAKYIIPEVTSEFALLFVPSEAIFAELYASYPDIIEVSSENHVFIVSPATLMMALNTVRSVVNTMEVQRSARDVIRGLRTVALDAGRMHERATKLERSLNTSAKHAHDVVISSQKIHKSVQNLEKTNQELVADDLGELEALGESDADTSK